MKKLIFICLAAVMMFALQSCESCSAPQLNGEDLIYDVTATADGEVEFTWMNGGATINGNAEIWQCNDTTKVLKAAKANEATPLEAALNAEDPEVAKAAQEVNSFIKVKGVDGKYHLTVKGYVKYGPILFEINEVYPKDEPVEEVAEEVTEEVKE